LSGASTVTSNGNVHLDGPTTNTGTLTVPAGDTLELDPLTVLTNAAGGTIDLAGTGATLNAYFSGATVVNNGTIDAALTSGTATISVPVTNNTTGVIDLGTATLDATQGLTNIGTVNIGYQTFNVSGGLTLNSKGTVAFEVSATTHTKLGGHVAIDLASGYAPSVGTAVTLVTTTGTQSGSFIVDSSQIIGTTTTGWKMSNAGNKVVVTDRPLSDVAGTIAAPASATQTLPFTVNASVTDNGPEAASSAAVTLTLPTGLTVVAGTLPAGCTQPTATTVKCAAGTLAVSAEKTFTITLVGAASGSYTFTATATSANTDLVPANNKESAVVTVV